MSLDSVTSTATFGDFYLGGEFTPDLQGCAIAQGHDIHFVVRFLSTATAAHVTPFLRVS